MKITAFDSKNLKKNYLLVYFRILRYNIHVMSARNNLQKLLLVVTLVFSFLLSSITPPKVQAQATCSSIGVGITTNINGPLYSDNPANSITFTAENLIPGSTYTTYIWYNGWQHAEVTLISSSNGTITHTWNAATYPDIFTDTITAGSVAYDTRRIRLTGDGISLCTVDTFEIIDNEPIVESYRILQQYDADGDGIVDECGWAAGGCLVTNQDVIIETTIVMSADGSPATDLSILHNLSGLGQVQASNIGGGVYRSNQGQLDAGSKTLLVEENGFWSNPNLFSTSFQVVLPSQCNSCVPPADDDDGPPGVQSLDIYSFCKQINDSTQRAECESCLGGANGTYEGVWTAVGCISREPTSIARTFIRIGLSMSGGVALLMILAAGFILTTAEGNPKKASDAKEMVTAAIVGLVFVIFSVVILQFIGFTVLQIPGFGG